MQTIIPNGANRKAKFSARERLRTMLIELGFGGGTQTVAIPDENYEGSLMPNSVESAPAGEEAVRRALAEPIGSPPLRSLVRPGERIAIVTSDITRPMPTARVMPALLEELCAAGVSPGDITLVFALGSHRSTPAGDAAWPGRGSRPDPVREFDPERLRAHGRHAAGYAG